MPLSYPHSRDACSSLYWMPVLFFILITRCESFMAEDIAHTAYHDGYSQGLGFTLSLCLCYTLCILGLRLYIRWRAFSVDDLVIAIASALAMLFFGCSYALKAAGLAQPLESFVAEQGKIDRLNSLTLVNNLSWIGSLCLSKMAIVSTLLHITLATAHRRFQYLVGFLITVQCIVTIVVLTARCSDFDGLAWDVRLNGTVCRHQTLRWRAVTGLDIATELAILALPILLVWNLQMPVKSKVVVTAAFWLRIPTLVFTSFRNRATNSLGSTSDVSLTAGMVVIWQCLELSYSLAAATIAALKRFTESLNTGFGHGGLVRVHGRTQSYKLSDRSASSKDSRALKPSVSIATEDIHDDGLQEQWRTRVRSRQPRLRPDDTCNEAGVTSLPQEYVSGPSMPHDTQEEESIIRHDVQYSIHYDEEPLVTGHNH